MATSDLQAALAKTQRNARVATVLLGQKRMKKILEKAQRDLEDRLRATVATGAGADSFTAAQLKATLVQIKAIAKDVSRGIQVTLLAGAKEAAEAASDHTLEYLAVAEKKFKGVGTQPLALREATIIDKATSGAQASVLRRLASSGTPAKNADALPHRAKDGILERYGMRTIGHFEEILQGGLVTRKPWAEVRQQITKASPFLEGAPAHWAERIVRTETMGIYGRASFESVKAADDELGDMVKIAAAVFDDRTGADSIAIHGAIRRPDEPFQSWFGLFQHPPDRPNDRSCIVPHRISWPIPDYLAWRSDAEVFARWKKEGRKGAPPPRPKMTTVPLSKFGRDEGDEEKKPERRKA